MQVIKFFDGTEKVLQDDEAENVKRFWLQSSDAPILLRNGTVINPKGISSIGEPDVIPTFWGYPLYKDGRSFTRNGERVYLEAEHFSQIEYKLHPKYGEGTIDIPKQEQIQEAFSKVEEDQKNGLKYQPALETLLKKLTK